VLKSVFVFSGLGVLAAFLNGGQRYKIYMTKWQTTAIPQMDFMRAATVFYTNNTATR
jgi:hypothetical protein